MHLSSYTSLHYPSGAWGDDDNLYFTNGHNGISRILSTGEASAILTSPDPESNEVWHGFPDILPGTHALLFTAGHSPGLANTNIKLLNLDTDNVSQLVEENGYHPRMVNSSHIVYSLPDHSLMSVPFDIGRLSLAGSSTAILSGVYSERTSFAANGTLAFIPGYEWIGHSTMFWVDRFGNAEQLTDQRIIYSVPRISPDGAMMVVEINDGEEISGYDSEGDAFLPLNSEGLNHEPVWSPDSRSVAWSSTMAGDTLDTIFLIPADQSEEPEPLYSSDYVILPTSWSPDGSALLFYEQNPDTGNDIWILSFPEKHAFPYLTSQSSEFMPMFAPDGKWIAYIWDETGAFEVYVRRYPDSGEMWQISNGGGYQPLWAPQGNELFYRKGMKVFSVAIESESTFSVKGTREWFDGMNFYVRNYSDYEVHPYNNKFIFSTVETESQAHNIHLARSWLGH